MYLQAADLPIQLNVRKCCSTLYDNKVHFLIFVNASCLCDVVVYHKFDITITMRNIGLGKSVEVKPLNEDVAVNLAAEMLGELFVFAVGVLILISEYRRQQRRDMIKEDTQNRRLQELESGIRELELSVETQSVMLREINRALAAADIKALGAQTSELPKTILDSSSKTVLKVSNMTPAKS